MEKGIGRDATLPEIRTASNSLIGKTLGDIGSKLNGVDSTKIKGKPGEILERYFGMDNDAKEDPDFRRIGIELKCKPLKVSYGKYFYPKEPLSIGMINYEEVTDTEDWKKIEKLQKKFLNLMIFWFVHDKENLDQSEFIWWQIWSPSRELDEKIQKEYEEIRRQILEGEHLSQTRAGNDILQTCPKHNYDFNAREKGSYVVNSGHPKLDKPERRSWRIPARFLVKILAESADLELVDKGRASYVRIEDLRRKSEEKSDFLE